MRHEDHTIIRRLALFADMAEEHFAALMEAAYLQRFPPQVQLVTEGDPADFLYVLIEGRVELFASANGRETTLSVARPVTAFILAASLRDTVYLMSARTTEKSRVLMIPSENLRAMMTADGALARAMISELAAAFRDGVKTLKNQKLRTGVERLANYLLRLHDEQGGGGALVLDMDKRTLASLLGMTAENLSRAFGTLSGYGVEVNGASIRLANLGDLRRLARPTPLIDDPAT